MSEEISTEEISTEAAGSASDAGGGAVDGEIMQALASGDLPNQLAGMTSALQEQLLSITQEMNKLKSELYSEQGGLAPLEATEQAGLLQIS